MIKALTKVLTMVITGMIFTFSLTGCTPDENHSQSEVSQPETSLAISSASETFQRKS